MKNPVAFYAAIALGIIIALVGVYMKVGMHFQGKAYAAIALGVIVLIAGIAGMVVMKPKAA